jgi:hypothetical protein
MYTHLNYKCTPFQVAENGIVFGNGFKFDSDLIWILLAMAGGVARYLDEYLRTSITPSVGKLCANALVSGFSGFIVAQATLKLSPDWALVAAGVGGYMGTQGLEWISSVLKNRLGVSDAPKNVITKNETPKGDA